MAIIKGIKVGRTDVTSTYDNDISDSKSIEVTPVNLGVISKPEDTVYTGAEITPTPQVTVTFDGVVVILEEGIDYDLTYSNNIDVGIATVTATGKGNYTGTISAIWNITPADLTVVTFDMIFPYDGNEHFGNIIVETVGNQPYDIKYKLNESDEYNILNSPGVRLVSDSGLIYYKISAPNHYDEEGHYNLQIRQRTVELSWGISEWIYDGLSHSTTCEVANIVGNDNVVVMLSNNEITNIGYEVVTAIKLDGPDAYNYCLPNDDTIYKTIIVNTGSSVLYIKMSDVWIPVKKAFKKVNGSWVEQDLTTVFNTSEMYVNLT